MEEEPKIEEAAQEEPVVRNLLNIALRLEGLYRHASTHAAGVVMVTALLMNWCRYTAIHAPIFLLPSLI